MNILCIVILIFTVAMTISQFSGLFFSAKNTEPVTMLNVQPSHFGDDNNITLIDNNTGTAVKAWIKEVIVVDSCILSPKDFVMKLLVLIPLSLVSLVTWIMFVIYLVKLVFAINKGKVFTWKTIRLLRTAGWTTLISNAFCIISTFYLIYDPSRWLSPKGYIFDYSYAIEQIPSLLPGLLLLLMAQIFGIGLKQKEELEQVV